LTPLRRNAIANVVGRGATVLLWVMVSPYILRHLGAERFGIWALFFAFTGYLVALDLGVGSTMIRFISAERASGDRAAVTRELWRGLMLALGLGRFWAAIIWQVARGAMVRHRGLPAS